MKITLTGSLGNISRPLTEILVHQGHDISVISSNPKNITAIESLGAAARIGSVGDRSFLAQAFKHADIIYTMIPTNFASPDYRKYMAGIGENYAAAIRETGVSKLINLSSIGAEHNSGTGPVTGLHDVEGILDGLAGVSVKHMRAGFFYINFLNDIGMIRNAGIMGSNYPETALMCLVHPRDIAATVAEEINKPFAGKTVRYVISDEKTAGEIAARIGAAIHKPALSWVEFSDEQALQGMAAAGLPPEIARNYVEMGAAIRSGKLWSDYKLQKSVVLGKTKLKDFALEFAEKFNLTDPARV